MALHRDEHSFSSDLPSFARLSPTTAQNDALATEEGAWGLDPIEEEWIARQPYFASRGYTLRPRYRPGWTPSWVRDGIDPNYCEDAFPQILPQILDATTSDGIVVCLKWTKATTKEIEIARFLSSERNILDPRNHCVPIFDAFPDILEPEKAFIVMPLLRLFNDPDFAYMGEVFDFARQTLEGLAFMHSSGVAHRDCAGPNIMMDARPLYPQGWHPVRRDRSRNGIRDLTPLARIDHPVRYYFVDYGLSTLFQPGQPRYVVGDKGIDRTAPELSKTTPYDPFKVDIFVLGHLYQTDFSERYYGLDSLDPLVRVMTAKNPNQRPTAEEALKLLQHLTFHFKSETLRTRLRRRDESVPERIFNNIRHFVGQ